MCIVVTATQLEAASRVAPQRLRLEAGLDAYPIQREAARHYGVQLSKMLSRSRIGSVAAARTVAMYLTRKRLNVSFPAVGRAFSRDHSTAIHAFNLVPKSPNLLKAAVKIEAILDGRVN